MIHDQLCYTGRCKYAFISLILFGLSVFVWNAYMFTKGDDWIAQDPFNKKIIDWPLLENCCSWWPILHFIGFALLGWLFPNCWGLLFIGGILWELLEVVMNYLTKGTVVKQPMRVTSQKVEYSDVWWAGSFKDILFNGAGIFLGRTLRLQLNPPT